MKISLFSLLIIALISTQACKVKTETADKTANEAQTESADAKANDNPNRISCDAVGGFRFAFKTYDGLRNALGNENVSEQKEDAMEGMFATIKANKDNFNVYFDDNGNILSVSVYEGDFTTENNIKPKMTLEDLEKAMGGAFDCDYSDEIGLLSFHMGSKCLVGILATTIKDKHISELLPLALIQQGKFKSNHPDLVSAKVYLSEIRILAPQIVSN